MSILNIKTIADAKKIVEDRNLDYIKIGVFDIDGVFRGKYMARSKFFSALENGFEFCDVVLGWDSNDQLYDSNVTFTGWHTGYGDASVHIIPESCRELPLENNALLFLGEFTGRAEQICPRGVLKRIIKKAEELGFRPFSSCEYELFLFDETADSIREKNYQNLKNISPGFFGYSMLRNSEYHEFYEELLSLCTKMDFPIEGLHTETGPGVLEAALLYSDSLTSADQGALFKTYTKVLAKKWDWLATFMAKWSLEYPGQSGHIHMSLRDLDGKMVFRDESASDEMSTTMRHFIGGQQQLMPEFLSMVSPTVNSYSRMVPGFWAPTDASWGVDNRTCALRAITGSPKSQRVEYRITAADINPYIAIAAALGAGLWGIENCIEPGEAVVGNAYDKEYDPKYKLPNTLTESANRLKKSDAARELFGDVFVDHYAATRIWENSEFNKHITDWELSRYFEII